MKKTYFGSLLIFFLIIHTTGCWRHNPNDQIGNQTDFSKNSIDSPATIKDENINGINSIKAINYQYAEFSDTIGKLFILQFEYPDKYVAEQIQNTISIGAPINEPVNDMTNTMEWFIAIEDGGVYPVKYIMDQEIAMLEIGDVAFQDTIKLSGRDAVRLTIQRNGTTRIVIAQEKDPVTIVIKNQGRIEGFERFFESIKFVELINQ